MSGKVQAVHDEAANEIRFTCTCGNVVRVERPHPFELLSLYQGGMYAMCGECGMTSKLELSEVEQ